MNHANERTKEGSRFGVFGWILVAAVALDFCGFAQDRSQARSLVITRYGIVATEHPLASQIGAQILSQGGNAIDAAVAANAATGVMAPMANGMGGDLFAIVYEAKSGRLYGLNASGWAPRGLTPEFLKSQGFSEMPQSGINSVTVPGVVDGWDKLLKRFGRKKLSTVLAPAIRYAEEGFPVTEIFSSYWVASERKLRADTNAARTFLSSGRAPRTGEIFRNPEVAWALKEVAAHGRNAFYKGEISRRLLACSKRLGGTMTAEDLADFSSQWVEPISTTYRGWQVYELPPNGQGIGALAMLNLMETFPLSDYGTGSANALHVMIEAKKLAYADVLNFVCDPKFNNVPVAGILSKAYAGERAKLIDLSKANCHVQHGAPPRMGTDTTYLCVVDGEGNMVSYIQSNYNSFGSGVVPAGLGFALQNRGGLFSLDPKSPNVLAGRKRPLHTIIPAFMSKGDVRIAFGIMGGWNQSQAHAQFVSDLVDFKMNIQAALEAPRFTKLTFGGCDVEVERRIPEPVRKELANRGHKLELKGDFTASVGGGQAVMRDFAAGISYGASDPRKDGAAIPQPLP
ncbi:MAG TPA: gamma-glutamyltransferase [Candidatus Dormibacteraeota bacterium]|nr:gamma-glutamyltransferase [Candidatus Dormibacteraeota bacterium]